MVGVFLRRGDGVCGVDVCRWLGDVYQGYVWDSWAGYGSLRLGVGVLGRVWEYEAGYGILGWVWESEAGYGSLGLGMGV